MQEISNFVQEFEIKLMKLASPQCNASNKSLNSFNFPDLAFYLV